MSRTGCDGRHSYRRLNIGPIISITPSGKVRGDLCLIRTKSDLTSGLRHKVQEGYPPPPTLPRLRERRKQVSPGAQGHPLPPPLVPVYGTTAELAPGEESDPHPPIGRAQRIGSGHGIPTPHPGHPAGSGRRYPIPPPPPPSSRYLGHDRSTRAQGDVAPPPPQGPSRGSGQRIESGNTPPPPHQSLTCSRWRK